MPQKESRSQAELLAQLAAKDAIIADVKANRDMLNEHIKHLSATIQKMSEDRKHLESRLVEHAFKREAEAVRQQVVDAKIESRLNQVERKLAVLPALIENIRGEHARIDVAESKVMDLSHIVAHYVMSTDGKRKPAAKKTAKKAARSPVGVKRVKRP